MRIGSGELGSMATPLSGRCFLSILDFDPEDLLHCLRLAAAVKHDRHLGKEAATSAALTES